MSIQASGWMDGFSNSLMEKWAGPTQGGSPVGHCLPQKAGTSKGYTLRLRVNQKSISLSPPLAWEPPHAADVALKSKKKKKVGVSTFGPAFTRQGDCSPRVVPVGTRHMTSLCSTKEMSPDVHNACWLLRVPSRLIKGQRLGKVTALRAHAMDW